MASGYWFDKVYRYCERGNDHTFWAEPANAITNGAFVLAGLAALYLIARKPAGTRGVMPAVLSVIVIAIGIGSFLFHTFAERWSIYADTIPIGIFMVTYLAYALRQFMRWNWLFVAGGVGAFYASLSYAATIRCRPGLFTATGPGPCMNGTIGYAPALIALIIVGLVLAFQRHPAWKYLLAAAAVFLLSMTARTIDIETCQMVRIAGYRLGTHFLWHTFNGVMLFILLLAAIRHGPRRPEKPKASR